MSARDPGGPAWRASAGQIHPLRQRLGAGLGVHRSRGRSAMQRAFLLCLLLALPATALIAASADIWDIQTVDSAESVGFYNSIALDSKDKVHISYSDWFPNYDLKYATNASGDWTTEVVDNAYVGWYTSLALDSNDRAHISYQDVSGDGLKYATNVSGMWQSYSLGSASGESTSIALDSTDHVHISSYSWWYGLLQYTTNAAGPWQTVTLDDVGFNGSDTSIAVDSADKVHISYRIYDWPEYGLWYATNSSGTWVLENVDDSGDAGYHASLALDAHDKAHISSIDVGGFPPQPLLRYATNASGSWQIETVTPVGQINAPTSIDVDSSDAVHISFLVYGEGLHHATNAPGSWVIEKVDSGDLLGHDSSIAVDSLDRVHVSYLDWDNEDLKYATNALAPPAPDIKANGSDGPLWVNPQEDVDLTIALDPGGLAGLHCDWLGGARSSYGPFPLFGFQAPLFELPATSVYEGPLARGWYLFVFLVDCTPGPEAGTRWWDHVVVVSRAPGEGMVELPDFEDLVQQEVDTLAGD